MTLLLEDEAARVADALYNSVRPMLAVSNGRHVLMSTPFGKQNHFFKIWDQERDLWQWFEIPGGNVPTHNERVLRRGAEDEPMV